MLVRRIGDSIQVKTPAKINLFLSILGKRADGYHEVETLLCPIDLLDTLTLTPTKGRSIEFEIELPSNAKAEDPAWLIPSDGRNLVVRALELLAARLGIDSGWRVRLRKVIPAAAGLGGGSSNAAAAVVAALAVEERWDRKLATEVCSSLGSDIPFFIGGPTAAGFALATGRGEVCQFLDFAPNLSFLLTHPPAGCSTQAVYATYQPVHFPKQSQEILRACQTGQNQMIGAALFNALQSSASSINDWINRQLELFTEFGLPHAMMSGSGSSCFALLDSAIDLELFKNAASQRGIGRVYKVKPWYSPSIEAQLQRPC